MTLTQLQYICALVNHNSLASAAESLFISQQALSKAINKLELELGYKLISRTHQGISLTKDGLLFVKRAKKILEQIDDLYTLHDFTIKPSQIEKNLELYVSCYFQHRATAKILSYFSEHYPKVHLTVTESINIQTIPYVMSNLSKDIIGIFGIIEPVNSPIDISSYCGIDSAKITCTKASENPIVAICSKDAPFITNDAIHIHALEKYPVHTVMLHGINDVFNYFFNINANIVNFSRQVDDHMNDNILNNNAIYLMDESFLDIIDLVPQNTIVPLAEPLKIVQYYIYSNNLKITEVEKALFEQTAKIFA